jgi:hypothetical protein
MECRFMLAGRRLSRLLRISLFMMQPVQVAIHSQVASQETEAVKVHNVNMVMY